ncbi:MAG: nucleoside hydrolase [Bryobacteraceae bacterium]
MRILVLFLSLSFLCSAQKPVIFDTDMGNDVDDALALAILHSLSSRHECRLIGVTLTNANASAVPYVRLVNAFYGRGELPVGSALKSIKGGAEDHYLSAALRSAPHDLTASSHQDKPAQPAVDVLRKLLAESTEKVTIVQVGFSTNLAALLDSRPDSVSRLSGLELVREKVALVSAMAGNFTGGEPEYNVKLDIPAAKTVFERWPTPIIFSGFEIGRDLLYPASSIEHDFKYVPWHPAAASYRAYGKMPYQRPTWDLTAALQAVRGDHGYFGLSPKGQVRVANNGATTFESGSGDRQFLRLDAGKKSRILEALTLLASEPSTH